MRTYRTLPPLEGLSAVLAAAHSGSFSGAAEELGVTHGTISRRVQAVESWLGTRLFERQARGVSLSPAGQRFVAETDRALRIIAQTAEQWRPRRGIPVVRVSAVPAFAKLWLLPRLKALQGDPADLRVELLLEHRLADILSGQADIALRYGEGEWPGVDARALFGETLYPVAAPGLVGTDGAGASAGTIAALPLLHDSDVSQWRAWLSGEGVRYSPRAMDRRFEDYDLVLSAAEAGLGAALMRAPLAEAWVRDGRLVPLSRRRVGNPFRHALVTRPGESRPAVLRFVERAMASGR